LQRLSFSAPLLSAAMLHAQAVPAADAPVAPTQTTTPSATMQAAAL
jgi:hypothetical protein